MVHTELITIELFSVHPISTYPANLQFLKAEVNNPYRKTLLRGCYNLVTIKQGCYMLGTRL